MVTCKFVDVSPARAKEWLKHNKNNRPFKKRAIKEYALSMRQGWLLTGDTIKFDDKGNLIDGQNRLMASVESGCSFPCFVVEGLDKNVYNVLDQGVKRTVADALARDGYAYYTSKASAARYIWLLEHGATSAFSGKLSIKEGLRIIKKYQWMEQLAEWVALNQSRDCCLTPSMLLAFFVYTAEKHGFSKVKGFWEPISSLVGLEQDSPQIKLIRRLTNVRDELSRDQVINLTAKAFRSYIDKSPIDRLKWTPDEGPIQF
jgi:hypothetical protein